MKYANNKGDQMEKEIPNKGEEIKETSPSQQETTGPETKNGIVANTLFVNVRKHPRGDAEKLSTMRRGEKVMILGKVGGFYKVSIGHDEIGYISSDFVKEE